MPLIVRSGQSPRLERRTMAGAASEPHHPAWFETAAARPPHHEGGGGDQMTFGLSPPSPGPPAPTPLIVRSGQSPRLERRTMAGAAPEPRHPAWFETAAPRPPHHEGGGGGQMSLGLSSSPSSPSSPGPPAPKPLIVRSGQSPRLERRTTPGAAPEPHHPAWFETAVPRPPHHEGEGGDQMSLGLSSSPSSPSSPSSRPKAPHREERAKPASRTTHHGWRSP